jgi:hypothetical protein
LVSLDSYAHVDLFKKSLTKALSARYGSPEDVDQALGEGTYNGVKQSYGGLSSWRKAWSRHRDEQKARYLKQLKAMDALKDAVGACLDGEVTDTDIMNVVQKMLNEPDRFTALKVQPVLSRAL